MPAGNETRVKIAILGAGPTGIGAAWRLSQHISSQDISSNDSRENDNRDNDNREDVNRERGPCDCQPLLLIDESTVPGGRASSITTAEGFTFDYGGHVLFPHLEYAEFIELLDRVIPEWHRSMPVRGVWLANRFIPTPVQRNIHRLPLLALVECLWGLLRRAPAEPGEAEPSLQQYLEGQFGEPLTRHVLGPLNRKMWAHDPQALGSAWSSHHSGSKEKNIPDVRVLAVLRNLLLNRDEAGWTEATTVRYPLKGGVGAIWERVFALLPPSCRRLGSRVTQLDAGMKKLWFSDGSAVRYERLVSSIPLDHLLGMIRDQPELRSRSMEFRAAKVQLFGFGLSGAIPEVLRNVHAVNIPDPSVPFWRVNFPSNFSPGNVPASSTWSILCECSFSRESDARYEPAEIEAALRQIGFLRSSNTVISTFTSALEHGYPVPFAGRNKLLDQVQAELEGLEIYSRGRFGGWRYEVSNQDHAFMQGVEVADRLLDGKAETTYRKTW
jgi:protoporphyrinogen oxidase